jgi:aldose 1-epimerase
VNDAPTLVVAATRALRLTVAPEIGASVVALEACAGGTWRPVLRPTPPDAIAQRNPSLCAMFLLAPWSNRIAGARFEWRGREIVLRANTSEGHAIHGDVRRRAWRLHADDDASIECRFASRDFADFNFPFPLEAAVRYELAGARFAARLTVRNAGTEAMPCGLGFHPYFPREGAGSPNDARLRLVARSVYPPLPSGPTQPTPPELLFERERALGACAADHCLRDWDGRARLVDPASGLASELAAGPTLDHVILFTPPGKPFYAVEPVSICNHGFALHARGQAGTGTRELAPGEELVGEFTLDVGEAAAGRTG